MADAPSAAALYAGLLLGPEADLDGLIRRLLTFAKARGLALSHTVSEIGSGLNGRRPKLLRLLADLSVQTIVIEHRDRLCASGANMWKRPWRPGAPAGGGGAGRGEDDLVQDMLEVLTSFCAWLHCRRWARNRARKALAATAAK